MIGWLILALFVVGFIVYLFGHGPWDGGGRTA